MTFRVGQKVVCIAESRGGGYPDDKRPVVGSVYTIRGIEIDRRGCIDPIGVLLEEIVNEPRMYRGYDEPSEVSFASTRFRPVVERKTDISIFTEILRKASKPARGPAFSSPHGASND
jgi:hypothetical protein